MYTIFVRAFRLFNVYLHKQRYLKIIKKILVVSVGHHL